MKKILIVADDASTKCASIIEECIKRGIQVETTTFKDLTIQKVYQVNGLILDRGQITYLDGEPLWCECDQILREMEIRNYRTPSLIISEVGTHSNYVFVRNRIEAWDEQNKKFLAFLKEIEWSVY